MFFYEDDDNPVQPHDLIQAAKVLPTSESFPDPDIRLYSNFEKPFLTAGFHTSVFRKKLLYQLTPIGTDFFESIEFGCICTVNCGDARGSVLVLFLKNGALEANNELLKSIEYQRGSVSHSLQCVFFSDLDAPEEASKASVIKLDNFLKQWVSTHTRK